jgi:hypothetical protein
MQKRVVISDCITHNPLASKFALLPNINSIYIYLCSKEENGAVTYLFVICNHALSVTQAA